MSEQALQPASSDQLFVGREKEISRLKADLEQVTLNVGRIVMLAGEAGIGKTRIVEELSKTAKNQDVEVLWGRCYEGEGAPLYWAWIEAIRGYLHNHDAEEVQRYMEGGASEIAAIVPHVAEHLKELPPIKPLDDPLAARFRFFDSTVTFLKNAARVGSLVVVLEDLHWADEPTLLLLEFLAHRLGEMKILIVGTYRDVEVGQSHPLQQTLGDLTRQRQFDRIQLRGLSKAAVQEYVNGISGVAKTDELADDVYKRSEGNPLFMTETVRMLIEDAEFLTEESIHIKNHAVQIPQGIQELISRRLSRLSADCNRVLATASVVGHEFAGKVLLKLFKEMNEDQLIEALEEAIEVGLLEEVSIAYDRYRFNHALTQQVLSEKLSATRRARLHGAIAEVLEELYKTNLEQHIEELANHYERCAAPENGMDYIVRCGDKASALFANREAISRYGVAMDICRAVGNDADETLTEVSMKRGLVNATMADYTAALEDFECMLFAARKLSDRHHEGLALWSRGFVENLDHDYDKCVKSFESARLIGEEGYDDVRLAASTWLAITHQGAFENWEAAEALFREADRLVSRVENPIALGWWSFFRTFTLLWEGRFNEVLEHLSAWRDVVDKIPFPFLSVRKFQSAAHGWFEGMALGGNGQYSEATAVLESAYADSERVADEFYRTRIMNTMGWIYGELQDFERAMDWNRRGAEAARTAGFLDPETENNALLNLGDNLMALNRLEEAEACFQKVESIVQNPRPRDRWMLWRYSQHMCHSYGELLLAKGEYHSALEYAVECVNRAEMTKSVKNVVKGRRLCGQVHMARGELAQADAELVPALEAARMIDNPPQLWKTLTALGLLRQKQGKAIESLQLFNEAVQIIDNVADGLADGPTKDAFLSSKEVQNIRRLVAGLPEEPGVEAKESYRDGLSEREVDVLRLVAKGLTNKEIGEQLFISVKTVNTHVSNIFAKAGLANRAAATAYAIRHGLTDYT
jgi:DNA-binding CsgD family transcriptional regulator